MVEKISKDGIPDRSVEMDEVARDWWQDDDARLLPGEEGGATTFAVEFEDGCRYFGYTSGNVFRRLVDLMSSPLDGGSDAFVREHGEQMAYLVWCVASGLGEICAKDLRDELVSQAPGEVYVAHETTVTTSNCWLKEGGPHVEVMSFAEWMELQETEADGPIPEYVFP